MTGLPYAAANANHAPAGSMEFGRTTLGGINMIAMVNGNSSTMFFQYSQSDGNPVQMTAASMHQTTPYQTGTAIYYTD